MEHRARLTLEIYNDDRSNYLKAEKFVTFPFLPFIGLQIGVGFYHKVKIVEIEWYEESEIFLCILEDNPKNHNFFDSNSSSIELEESVVVLADAKESGWSFDDNIYGKNYKLNISKKESE